MLIFIALGLMIGMALGDEARRRKNAEEQLEDLREQLVQSREIRAVLNDTHRRVVAVSKGLEKLHR